MAFVVTGTKSSQAVTFSFETPVVALQKARELEQGSGIDVVLTDADGLQYGTPAFERVFIGDEPTI